MLYAFGAFLASLAPIPDPFDRILFWSALASVLTFTCASRWEDRHERQTEQSGSAAASSGDQPTT